jgi:hydrogenase-4 component B
LAYSSVENVGVIAFGIGLGILGQGLGNATVAYLGFAGALLHVINHGLFKSLLFMGAGGIIHATGTGDMTALGGLGRRMPVTAATFLTGCAAISALPPLNGFVGEWLIYMAAFVGAADFPTAWAACALAVAPALALVGGFTAACFVKAFGGVFLGRARSQAVSSAHECHRLMGLPMILCSIACVVLGLWPLGAVSLASPAATAVGGPGGAPPGVVDSLLAITRAATLLLVVIAVLLVVRRLLMRGREVKEAATWGCGYAAPTPRMQYTPASFAAPLLDPFSPVLQTRTRRTGPTGFFPVHASYQKYFGDMAGERLLVPATRRLLRTLDRFHVLQQGRLHLYLAYIAVTLVVLLVWQLTGVSHQ